MAERIQYKTKHKEELLAFLKEREGEHIVVADIYNYFTEQGNTIGTATIYRQLEHLVDEGLVNKYVLDANTPACFEYINRDANCHQSCIHCKCVSCGKLIHLKCSGFLEIGEHIKEHHDFELDLQRTVIYGVCGNCKVA